MSTYNSKFSGAEIDALLEKVDSGQVGGGGGSSEMEELAKEVGATHKHTITLTNPPALGGAKVRGITYTNSADPLTVNRLEQLLGFANGAYVIGVWAMSAGGVTAAGSALWCLSEAGLTIITSQVAAAPTLVTSVDFDASTVTTVSIPLLGSESVIPVSQVIEAGGILNDDVTEL